MDEESLAIFDLLKKSEMSATDVRRIKKVAVELLDQLKQEKLRVDHWRDKEATRDAVSVAIHDFPWSDKTGLPVTLYSVEDVSTRAEEIYRHVYRVYPTVPSPFYSSTVSA